jgi:hypothetical protein
VHSIVEASNAMVVADIRPAAGAEEAKRMLVPQIDPRHSFMTSPGSVNPKAATP